MDNYHLNQILVEKKITDYLDGRGISPVRFKGDKFVYRCPIHKGDNDPSFVVYEVGHKGRNYQTYHCFACHSGVNIINLMSDMEERSIKEVLSDLLQNVKIDEVDRMDSLIKDANYFGDLDEISDDLVSDDHKIEFILLKISLSFRQHLEYIDFDEEEIAYFEKPFEIIDKIARDKDLDSLEKAYNLLVEQVFVKRVEEHQKKEEAKILIKVNGSQWRS